MNKFDFNTPVNKELSSIANERGEELIGAAIEERDPRRMCDYRLFKLTCGHTQDIRTTHYRKNNYTCKICFEKDIHDVAESQGLELVSMDIVRHCNDRLYVRSCGHTEIFSNNYLRKHKIIECQECVLQEVKDNIAKINFSFVKKVREGYLISCNRCGEEVSCSTTTARSGKPTCNTCFNEKLKEEAELNGFTYIPDMSPEKVKTESRTSLYRWYSCNACGSIESFQHTAMRYSVSCKNCFNIKLAKEAESQGMVHLGHSEGGYHKYKLSCGCIREFPPHSVRKAVWACKVHDNTYYHRPSSVYLIKITSKDFSWLKLGFAKNLDIRIKGYGLSDDYDVEILFNSEFSTGYEAMELEKSIHKSLSNIRLDSGLMKSYMTSTGHTECYPVEAESEILSKLEVILSE